MLDPSFDWASNEIWAQACATLGQADNCELVQFPTDPNRIPGFLRFGASVPESDVLGESSESVSRVGEVISHPDFGRFEKTCTVLFRRDNHYGELREIDAEIFLHALLEHFCHLIDTHQPDLVLFPVTPHFVETYSLWFCAEVLGVRTLWFQPSSLAPMMLPRESFSDFLRVSDFIDGVSSESLAIAHQSVTAGIAKLQNLDIQPYIQRQKNATSSARTLRGRLRATKAIVRWMRTDRFSSRFVVSTESAIPLRLEKILQIFVPRSILQALRSKASDYSSALNTEIPYALFALHYEPERTSVPEGGDEMSQLQYLLKARNVLPESVTLRVREHSSQLSPALQGYKGRSPHFYELVVKRLGMELDLDTPMKDLLGSSSVVFTVTGNIALEAALAGVPVVYFGNPWWEGMPGTYAFSSISRDDIATGKLVTSTSEAVKTFLRDRVVSGMIPGGASESESELVARFGEICKGFSTTAGTDLGTFLVNYCDTVETRSSLTKRR